MIASYFEVLDAADLAILVDRLELTGAEQAALAAGDGVPDGYADMIELCCGNLCHSLSRMYRMPMCVTGYQIATRDCRLGW